VGINGKIIIGGNVINVIVRGLLKLSFNSKRKMNWNSNFKYVCPNCNFATNSKKVYDDHFNFKPHQDAV